MRAAPWKLAIGVFGLIWGQCASAVTIGSYTFADNAFADTLLTSLGTFSTTPSGTLESVLTDTDPTTGAFSNDAGAFVQLGFVDNLLVNGAGADLVLFEIGTPNQVAVSLSFGGTEKTYDFSSAGSVNGVAINEVAINLDDFNVAPDASFSSVIIRLDIEATNMTVPALSLVGALNTGVAPIPIPAAVWMFGSGLIGLVGIARRRRA